MSLSEEDGTSDLSSTEWPGFGICRGNKENADVADGAVLQKKLHPSVQRLLDFPRIAQKSPEWFEYRKSRVTASEVSIVVANGKGAKSLMHRKKFEQNRKGYENDHMKLGVQNESRVVDIYRSMFPELVVFEDLSIIPHQTYNYVAASLDACTNTGINVEIKTTCKDFITSVPKTYYDQVQLQMEVADLDLTHLVYHHVNLPGKPIKIHEIQRNRDWFETYRPTIEQFILDLEAYFPFDLDHINGELRARA